MVVEGSREHVWPLPLAWESALYGAGRRLAWGSLAALVVLVLYLALSLKSATTGDVFGIIAFLLAIFSLSVELTPRSFLQAAPTIIACLIFLSVS